MTALERIKGIEFECSEDNKENLNTYLKDPDVRFLLKAFKEMYGIATCFQPPEVNRIRFKEEIDKEFEERMK
jgi:hypothetical protein